MNQMVMALTQMLEGLSSLAAMGQDALVQVTAVIPDPDPDAPPGVDESASTFIAWLKWGAGAAGVVGLIVCGVMMILGRRNRSQLAVDGAAGIPWVFGGLSLVALSTSIVIAVFE